MVLVALAMVAIIAMAALSIDVVTLYLAREEAQRSADAAALAAARVISISGITGTAAPSTDTASWTAICGPSGVATQTAQTVGMQNSVGSVAGTVSVNYSVGSGQLSSDCSGLSPAFAVNPMVTVQVTRGSLPTFFSRVWGNTGNNVSASATAEVFNPSKSGGVGLGNGNITPVQPRCVKPWVVPNLDPWHPGPNSGIYCQPGGAGACQPFVRTADGSIVNPGISLNGNGNNGVIGETFWLLPDCRRGSSSCTLHNRGTLQPQPNYTTGSGEGPPNLLYVPGQVGTPVTAIPACTQGDPYEEAIEGCDAATNYQCGVAPPGNNNVVDLGRNPIGTTGTGVQCLIQQSNENDTNTSSGQDYLNYPTKFAAPGSYPFQILAGSDSALGSKAGLAGATVSSSPSIVSLPIYDNTTATINSGTTTDVTFVGFLQVFIDAVDQNGNVEVTVLNVAGCGSGNPPPNSSVTGSSPVPIRLITPR